MTIRLLLAEDQELIRSALSALLGLEEDFEVVATVGRGDEVVAAAREHHADVALLDIEMPGIDGLAAAAALAQEMPECRSLILTTFGRPGYPEACHGIGRTRIRRQGRGPLNSLLTPSAVCLPGNVSLTPHLPPRLSETVPLPSPLESVNVLVAARAGASVSEIAQRLSLVRRDSPQLPLSRDPQKRASGIGRRPFGRRKSTGGCDGTEPGGTDKAFMDRVGAVRPVRTNVDVSTGARAVPVGGTLPRIRESRGDAATKP